MTSCFRPCGQWVRIKYDVIFQISSPAGGTNWTSVQCLVEFIRMWYQGQSLLSVIDLLKLLDDLD